MCIVTVLSHGLRSGGGVGDVLRKPSKEVQTQERNNIGRKKYANWNKGDMMCVFCTFLQLLEVLIDTAANSWLISEWPWVAGVLTGFCWIQQEPLFAARVIYDLLFFFMVIIIVLNLIFGVIIDTFADLRSEKQKKEEILKTTCFICGERLHEDTNHRCLCSSQCRDNAVSVNVYRSAITLKPPSIAFVPLTPRK